jgi:hypothetical protein
MRIGMTADNRQTAPMFAIDLPEKIHKIDPKKLAEQLRKRLANFAVETQGTWKHPTGVSPEILGQLEEVLQFAKSEARPLHLKAWHLAKARTALAALLTGGIAAGVALPLSLRKKREKKASLIGEVKRRAHGA